MSKILFVCVVISLNYFAGFSQQNQEPCRNWYIEPVMFNNCVNISNEVLYWENYRFHLNGIDSSKLIPDTLKIKLVLVPSLELFDKTDLPNSEYTFKSIFFYKYSDREDSYNLFNPICSDTIILTDTIVNLNAILLMIRSRSGDFDKLFPVQSIPLKRMLIEQGIDLRISPWNYKNGKPMFLNQIIICSYFLDKNGNVVCSSELTFPINGAYNDGLSGIREY